MSQTARTRTPSAVSPRVLWTGLLGIAGLVFWLSCGREQGRESSEVGVENSALSTVTPRVLQQGGIVPIDRVAGAIPETLHGELHVASDGTAHYRVPIWTPPGRAGIEPKLAIVYDSGVGDGLLGMGWQLDGLSAITRCTIPGDTLPKGPYRILYQSSDFLCLDGQRLVPMKPGARLFDGQEFRTEEDRFAKIVQHGPGDGEGPTYFDVYTKDGRILRFGNDGTVNDGSVLRDNVNAGWLTPAWPGWVKARWALSRISDRFGNSLTYSYDVLTDTSTGPIGYTQLLRSIKYTSASRAGFTDLPPSREVTFDYEDRPDPTFRYFAGIRLRLGKRLSLITIKAIPNGGTALEALRTYTFTYAQGTTTRRSLLKSLKECVVDVDKSSVCLDPTSFSYEPGSTGFSLGLETGFTRWSSAIVGDFNGDGRDDVAAWVFAPVQIALSTGSGFNAPYAPNGLGTGTNNVPVAFGAALDVNGDGRDDILATYGVSFDAQTGIWGSQASGDFQELFRIRRAVSPGYYPMGTGAIVFGEINGDGFPDLMYHNDQTGNICYELNGGDGKFATSTFTYQNSTYPTMACFTGQTGPEYRRFKLPSELQFNPFGDGVSWFTGASGLMGSDTFQSTSGWTPSLDICGVIYGQYCLVDSTKPVNTYEFYGYFFGSSQRQGFNLDLNGDGIDDVFTAPSFPSSTATSGVATLSFGTGIGPTTPNRDWSLPASGIVPVPTDEYTIAPLDWDGDGNLDLLLAGVNAADGNGLLPGRTNLMILRGKQYAIGPSGVADYGFEVVDTFLPTMGRARILDANGDGLPDILIWTSDNHLRVVQHLGRPPDMLTSIQEGRGWKATITYSALVGPSSSSPYTSSGPAFSPPPKGKWAVSQVLESAGATSNQKTDKKLTYYYDDAVYGVGHRFLGFRQFREQDWSTGSLTAKRFDKLEQPLSAEFTRIYPFRASPTAIYTVVAGRYFDEIHKPIVFDGGTAPPFFVYDSSIQRTEHLFGQPPFVDVTTSFGMHPSGSPSSISTSSADNYVDTIVLTYGAEDPVNWYIGRPTRRTETSKVPAGTSETRTTSFEYEPDGGRLWATVIEPDDYPGAPSIADPSLKLRTELLREPDAGLGTGQVTSIRQAAGDDAGIRTTSTSYDRVDAIFTTVVVNPASMQTDFSWDRARGLQLGETDPNNISTRRDYDPKGRLRSETLVDPTGTLTGQERHLHYLASTDGGMLITEVSFDAGVKTRVDIFGRVIQRETIGFDGGTVLEEVAFDARDFLVSETAPHAAAVAGPLVQYVYDNSGRLGSTRWPDGTTSKITYAGLVASYTNQKGVLEAKVTRNQLGDVVSSTELLAGRSLVTSFTIRPFHEVSSIRYPGTAEKPSPNVTRDVDLRGRLRGSDDPDAKLTSAKYNSFGEMVSVTRPSGSTTYVRDALGRPKKMIHSVDGTTTLVWDSATNGIGQLGSVTGTSGIVTTHSYDGVGRRASVQRSFPLTTLFVAASYRFDFQYEKGRLKHVTYPSVPNGPPRFAVTYGYTNEGRLRTISEEDSVSVPLWTATSVDERGNVTGATLGSGYGTILRRLDVMNQLRFLESTGPQSTLKLQQLAYEYDVLGDLTWRHDLLARTSEQFVYDDLHRISTWSVDQNCLPSFNVTWGYDDSGNIRSRGGSLGSVTYAYNGTGVHALTGSSAGDSFSYDASGNQTSGPGYSIPATNRWGLPKQLKVGTLTWTYEYDGYDQRVRKSRDAQNAVVDIDGLYQQVISNGAVEHRFVVPAPDGTIVQVPWSLTSGTVTKLDPIFLLAERFGSVETIASKTGLVLARRKYDPFGVPLAPEDLRVPRDLSAISAFGFTGENYDPESRLHDFGGRIYDPRFGRFLSPDPNVPQPLSSQSYGRYAYARNAPTRRTDPTGRCDDEGLCIEGSTGTPWTPVGGPPYTPTQGGPSNPLYPCPGCYPVWYDTTPNRHAPSAPPRTDASGTRGGPYTINDVRQSVGREPTVGDIFTGDRARTRSILESDHELTENAMMACSPSECTDEWADAVREANSAINRRMVTELMPALLGYLSLTPATGVTRALVAPKPYNVWALDPFTRGRIIHRALGETLPPGFKTFDRFENGVATSIKSLDLGAKTYKSTVNLANTLRQYIDQAATFTRAARGGVRLESANISHRTLQIAVPPAATRAQQRVLQEAINYGESVGVEVTIIPFP